MFSTDLNFFQGDTEENVSGCFFLNTAYLLRANLFLSKMMMTQMTMQPLLMLTPITIPINRSFDPPSAMQQFMIITNNY